MGSGYLNVRLPEDLEQLIARAVLASGQTRAVWVREALEAGATREIEAEQERRQTQQRGARRRLGGRYVIRSGTCLHPVTARQPTIAGQVCMSCGQVVAR